MSKKVATTVYITEEQQQLLKSLNERSKIPVAEFIRQGIDLVINRYAEWLPGQLELGPLPSGELPPVEVDRTSTNESQQNQ
ncbi:MAG: transcriptional regulator [Bdellovibrionaceae bacterium]|nr:transcriptional regulator [Pseudobdellovibrionaceae bacterium]